MFRITVWKLEPVCCKKQQKHFMTSDWILEWGIFEDFEWYQIDPGWSGESLGLICNQFAIIQVLQRSPIWQTSNCSGTFFAVSYSKLALDNAYQFILFVLDITWRSIVPTSLISFQNSDTDTHSWYPPKNPWYILHNIFTVIFPCGFSGDDGVKVDHTA